MLVHPLREEIIPHIQTKPLLAQILFPITCPAGHSISGDEKDVIDLLGHLRTLLARVESAVKQQPWVLFC